MTTVYGWLALLPVALAGLFSLFNGQQQYSKRNFNGQKGIRPMFTLSKIDTIKTRVDIVIPGDMGKTQKGDFVAEIKKLPVSEAKDIMQDVERGNLSDEELLSQYVVDIKGIRGEDGAEVQFSEEVLTQLVDMEYVRKPLVDAFLKVQFGRDFLKRKNS